MTQLNHILTSKKKKPPHDFVNRKEKSDEQEWFSPHSRITRKVNFYMKIPST